MRVNYHCYFGAPTGYARAAHDNILALLSAGVDVAIVPFESYGPPELAERYRHLAELVVPTPDWEAVQIIHDKPWKAEERADAILRSSAFHGLSWKAEEWADAIVRDQPTANLVAYTTWETSRCPHDLSDFDLILTPSNFCRDALKHNSVEVEVVPHGIDFDFWAPKEREVPNPGTVFYTIGAWNERKNIAALIKAYFAAFERSDETTLIIHCDDPDLLQAQQLISQSGLPKERLPALQITGERWTDEQVRDLHYKGDFFVSMTRCEGWGLGAFEALAIGNPVIMPSYGGQRDFLPNADPTVGWQGTPCFPSDRLSVQNGQLVGVRNAPEGIDCTQQWVEPVINDMMQLMQQADRQLFKRKTSKLDKKFSLETIGRRFADVLHDHFS